MKQAILFIAILGLFSSCNEALEQCDCDDLVMNNQNLWTLDNKPYSGKCISYYQDSVIESEAEFVEGKFHGHILSYFPSGNLDEDCKWVNGLMADSVINYYETGEISSVAEFVKINDGKNTGYVKHFYKSGQLSEEGQIIDNNKEGVWRVYYENGQLKTLENWKSNIQVDSTYRYFENGQINIKGFLVEEKYDGKWTFFDSITGKIDGYLIYEDGKLKEEKYITKPIKR